MSCAQMDFLRSSPTAQENRVRLKNAEAPRAEEETQLLRDEIRVLWANIRDMGPPDARRWKRNRHGSLSWEDAGDEYERSGEFGGYHDGYGSYGRE